VDVFVLQPNQDQGVAFSVELEQQEGGVLEDPVDRPALHQVIVDGLQPISAVAVDVPGGQLGGGEGDHPPELEL
jgi:hypothetical protein